MPAQECPFPTLLAELNIPKKWADSDGDLGLVNWAWEQSLSRSVGQNGEDDWYDRDGDDPDFIETDGGLLSEGYA